MKSRSIPLLLWLLVRSLSAGPAHDARFLNVDIVYRLNRDGSWVMDYSHRVRLDTYQAINRILGESFIVYNPSFQSLRIIRAETTMAGGRKVAVPANGLNEVLPSAAHGFADFSQLREMVITHTGLERGAVIDLHYQVQTRPGFWPYFSGRETLAKAFPVDGFRLRVVVPQERTVNVQTLNLGVQPVVSRDNGETSFLLERKNVPPLPVEANSSENDLPAVVFSTASDWAAALPHLTEKEIPAPLLDRLERIRRQNPGVLETVLNLQKMVSVGIDNCPLEPMQTGLRCRSLAAVYDSNSGTEAEKALLLYALMDKMGMAPELLAVMGGRNLAEGVPTVLQVSHYLVRTETERGAAYLDPAALQSEFHPYGKEGFPAYNLDRKAFESLPARGVDRNRTDVSGRLTMTGEQLKGTLSVSWRGYPNRFRSAVENPKEWVSGALRKIFPLSDISVRKVLLLEPEETRVELDVSGKWLHPLAPSVLGLRSFSFPPVSPEWIQAGERSLPLHLEAPFSFAVRLSVELEKSAVPILAAADVHAETAVGSFHRTVRAAAASPLEIDVSLVVEKGTISAGEYPEFRKLLKNCLIADDLLLLKKTTTD